MRSWTLVIALSCVAVVGCKPRRYRQRHPQPPQQQTQHRCAPAAFHIVDLTHVMHDKIPIWPGGVPFKMERTVDYDEGYRLHKVEMGANIGTHVDAPAHFVEGGRGIDQIPVDELVVPAIVIDVREKVAQNADYQLSENDLVDWEAANGDIPVGSLVIANTGWHKRFIDAAKYFNQDDQGVMHFPGFAAGAAQLLIERDVVGIGIDTLSIDHGPSKDFATHKAMLAASKYQIENLANLDRLPVTGATVIIGVLPVADGSQAQARVLAMIPAKEVEEAFSGDGQEPPP
jgi:kynurenine formamidase